MVLPEPDGPNSNTEFPFRLESKTRDRPATEAGCYEVLIQVSRHKRKVTADVYPRQGAALLDWQGSSETWSSAEPQPSPAHCADLLAALLGPSYPLQRAYSGKRKVHNQELRKHRQTALLQHLVGNPRVTNPAYDVLFFIAISPSEHRQWSTLQRKGAWRPS